jgi:lantibiotic modifying enzyme
MESYNENFNYITKKYSVAPTDTSLYTGTAGVALALSTAFDSHLLSPTTTELWFENLFERNASGPALASGIAGQGIAMLKVRHWMHVEYSQQVLRAYIHSLLDSQCSDGSWPLTSSQDRKKRIELTLANGVPGIIWFLLNYLDGQSDNNVLKSVVKACNWLIRSTDHKSKQGCTWPIINNSRSGTTFSTDNGIPGIILVLIKAFMITGESRYRDVAISSLTSLPDRPHFNNFTLSNGLAGLGEIYLEAYKAFKDIIWLQRATWIAHLFVLTLQQSTTLSAGYWVMEGEQAITADLFTGNGGAIHFLMHYLLPDKMHHPLVPYSITKIHDVNVNTNISS